MNPKFRNLFIIGGSVALVLLIIQVFMTYPDINAVNILLNALPALVLYYLAYKTYHEHKDGELM
ncbi:MULTISPECIES: hypothetical protein [Mucilaginibacter]|jgi:Na+-translocating ferredoxin:NAD+ oxidoreductase RnfD subunit|uniref:Uncharacterized protein n=1 Tax=Mucilaginibacter ginsenosidivorax TaxID=862126 RepID=A0A5B8W3Y8_9SPHI|nr:MULTISPECIES: hypothetical protein [Mucilaginibacter]QEC78249.1 hypothetical protein FSB76_20740 [Mucilaginibacter ginsenosidivorax]SEO59929.1 hypothetical protein SAMN05428947_10378 [Mucilaginibacter sp. OK283]